MAEDRLSCPFANGSRVTDCLEFDCEVFDTNLERCSIRAISTTLSEMCNLLEKLVEWRVGP